MLITTCIACQYGQHERHTPIISVGLPGVIGGGARCECKGECAGNKPKSMLLAEKAIKDFYGPRRAKLIL